MDIDHSSAKRVVLLLDRLAQLSREMQFSAGLNPAQWEALRYLGRANTYSRSPGACAAFLGTTKGTASQTLIALEHKGYISRTRGRADRRQIHIQITPAGDALLARDPISTIERLAAQLDDHETDSLIYGLSRLLHGLQAENEHRDFGYCCDCSQLCEPDVSGKKGDDRRCGITGDRIEPIDQTRLCFNFRPTL